MAGNILGGIHGIRTSAGTNIMEKIKDYQHAAYGIIHQGKALMAVITWLETFGSGAKTGTIVMYIADIKAEVWFRHQVVRTVFCAAAHGTTAIPITFGVRIATASSQTTVTTTSGSVPRELYNTLYFYSFTLCARAARRKFFEIGCISFF